MKKINYRTIIRYLLISVIIFYLIFLFLDINNKYIKLSKNLKFICIILCFFISLLSRHNAFDLYNIKLLQIGLLLTVIADYFLLILDDYYEIGIAIFILAQITYSIRYATRKRSCIIKRYIKMLGGIFFLYIIINFFINIPLIIALGLSYGVCLVTNVYMSILVYKEKTFPKLNSIMVVAGMFLFLLCDINVAIFNIIKGVYFKYNSLVYQISLVSMWLFYLPSQLILSLSGYKFK